MSILIEFIEKSETIGIIGHIRPDGDDVGACLGTYNYIKTNYPDKKVKVFLETKLPRFAFLKGYEDICCKMEKTDADYDLVICQDASTYDRLGEFGCLLSTAKHSICVDHHKTNTLYCEYNEIRPEVSSTSEVLYELLDEGMIDHDIAECLYTGIVHDTGVFQYSSTSPRTMEIAGKLMSKGIRQDFIISYSFYQKSLAQLRAWGYAYQNAVSECDGKCLYAIFTWKDMSKCGVNSIELDGISAQLKLVKDVECSFLVYQDGQNSYKVSMRSGEKVDVSVIAAKFGGGGHMRAAGCSVQGEPEDIAKMIIREVKEQM